MKVAIMEPYFFPYLGHFDLINAADAWIAFDTSQYTRHRFGNRNRILHPKSGWQYIIVPVVKHSQKTPFCEMKIAEHINWRQRILGQLTHYKRSAPYYEPVFEFVQECLDFPETNLAKFTTRIFEKTSRRLGIMQPVYLLSEMGLDLSPKHSAGDWGWAISQQVGADEFINPCGGKEILDKEHYQKNGIQLTFQSYKHMEYKTRRYQFQPNLSIIDVMMWNSPEAIKEYLDLYGSARLSADIPQKDTAREVLRVASYV